MNISKQKKRNLKILTIIILIIISILIVIVTGYSKIVQKVTGSGTATVGDMILEVEGIPHDTEEDGVNPYCELIVKNYNEKDEITSLSMSYSISVNVEEGTVPDYYCLDEEGNEIANSIDGESNIRGEIGCSEKQEKIYKVYFVNVGTSDSVKDIKFDTVVTQKQ